MFVKIFISGYDDEDKGPNFQKGINRWISLASLHKLEVEFVKYTAMSDGRLSALIVYTANKEIE